MSVWIRSKIALGLFVGLLLPVAPAAAFTPTSAYKVQKIAGFTVLVHPKCFEQPADAMNKSMELLKHKLQELNHLIPKKQLAVLHKVHLWVEWDNRTKARPDGTACYHVDTGWLKNNGYNPDKVKSVEISMMHSLNHDFLYRDQPMVLLHEMTHAYHHQVLGHDNADVRAAFAQAKERKLYDKVLRVYFGRYEQPQLGYAISNDQEYLAELSESYFGVNDWFPFTWQDLRRHDPAGWQLMEKVWGPLERKENPVDLTVHNQTDKVAVMLWIEDDGKLKEYERIQPGAKIVRPTFTGHRWQVRLIGAPDRFFFVTPNKNTTWHVK